MCYQGRVLITYPTLMSASHSLRQWCSMGDFFAIPYNSIFDLSEEKLAINNSKTRPGY